MNHSPAAVRRKREKVPGDPPEAPEDLGAEIARGQRLDRDLARDLGHREPTRSQAASDYLQTLGQRPRLAPRVERRLVMAAKRGDPSARAELVDAFMPLIAATARTYRSGQVQRLELRQEGVVGLLRALERFDPIAGCPSGVTPRGGCARRCSNSSRSSRALSCSPIARYVISRA
jgi:DNA-directed RNA polymerase sigma subunit (sigma70/sigma32)